MLYLPLCSILPVAYLSQVFFLQVASVVELPSLCPFASLLQNQDYLLLRKLQQTIDLPELEWSSCLLLGEGKGDAISTVGVSVGEEMGFSLLSGVGIVPLDKLAHMKLNYLDMFSTLASLDVNSCISFIWCALWMSLFRCSSSFTVLDIYKTISGIRWTDTKVHDKKLILQSISSISWFLHKFLLALLKFF